MSPLGTLEISNKKSLFNYNLNPMYCVGNTNNATPSVPIPTNDHLVKLMSLSLVNTRGPSVALNLSPSKTFIGLHQNNLNLPDSSNTVSGFTEMLLKSGHLPGGSPVQIPSPNSSGSGHPESPRSTADTGMTPPPITCINTNDDDEVLSIGRDDDHQQLLQDCDSSVISDEDMKSTTTTKDFNISQGNDDNNSQESMEYDDLHDDRSSQNSSESHNNPSIRRNRKYSSEDSFTIKSLCSPTPNYHHNNNSNDTTTSTASPPPHNNTINSNCNSSNGNSNRHSSLLFSIANILRPDFGLCNNTTTSPFAPGKSLKSPPSIIDFNFNTNLKRSHHHSTQPNHKGSGRNDSLAINPIDLSRPSSTGSHQNHHHQNQHKISSSGRSSGVHANGNSSSSGNNNKRLKLNNESPNSLTKGNSNSNSEKNNSSSNTNNNNKSSSKTTSDGQTLWPAWVYCTRYSDRPSSGPRARRMRKNKEEKPEVDEKRPRTAFTAEQLARLKKEFDENRYLTEKRRQDLAKELRLHENQIKIWFQNKRAKLKKATGQRGGLALQLMAQGLYNHSTIKGGPDDDDDSD